MTNPYFTQNYLSKQRFISYWHQIDEVLKTRPKNVLEIGKGNGIVSEILMNYGIQMKTLDVDKSLKPNIVADIKTFQSNETFDTVLCAEVLEHLPFSDFDAILFNLKKLTRRYLIITLPEAILTYFHFSFKIIPFIKEINLTKKIYDKNKKIAPGHYWEIGEKKTPLSLVKETIKKYFHIQNDYQLKENRHRFLILKK